MSSRRQKFFFHFEEPVRSEIFSPHRLELHAESLAVAQKVTTNPKHGENFAPRVKENRYVLEQSYELLLKAVTEQRAITPAAEWLLDNFHIVRAQLKDIHDHLPPQFYKELPKLADGPLKGYPRVYGIAWAFIAHTDSRFDGDLLKLFLLAYQKIQPLKIGELWAVSITLRAVLIENLRRIAARIVGSQIARAEADAVADEILGLSDHKPRGISKLIEDLETRPFSRAFAVQLLQRLRFQERSAEPVLEWLYARLAKEGLIADELVSQEHLSQSSANVTVRNIITSSRTMSVFDWQIFFEDVSLVDAILRKHPNYGQMDFTSRDRYRHSLEDLSKNSNLSETQLAKRVLEKAEKASHAKHQYSIALRDRVCDPGYYLISGGRREFEKDIGFKAHLGRRILRWLEPATTFIFIGSILSFTLTLLSLSLWMTRPSIAFSHEIWLVLLAFFPACHISVAIINRLVVAILGPKHLPRLNLEKEIPSEFKTFVVVPTLFTHKDKIVEQLEQLETHCLANPDAHLRFALLTDWTDAFEEESAKDLEILKVAAEKLKELNQKFGLTANGEPRFYIYHRRRIYNPQEERWMGWERKRGKLHEFNALLRGRTNTSHISIDGQPIIVPAGIRYVITLDADTKLPRGAAAQLIGTLAHPLNRAYVDVNKKRVTHGYGILQPRITPSLPTIQDSTIFQRISAGPSGIDPYAAAVSDVYQDLFEEGSYTGKGIYDVDAFEKVLEKRVPENCLLSHDLFEGNFARAGFVSDIEFFEDFPSHAGVAALRSHRWIRGDWQLLPWLFTKKGKDIPWIGRWKMLDNLRRSLLSSTNFLLIISTLAIPNAGFGWLGLAFGSFFIPAILVFITDIFPKRRITPLREHLQFAVKDFVKGLEASLMEMTLLPFHSWMFTDAIVRALYRQWISKKHLLEWTTAAQAKAAASLTPESFWLSMKSVVFLSSVGALTIAFFNPSHFFFSAPFLMLWFVSPQVAHWLSSPPKILPKIVVRPEDIQLLTSTARRIWRFFATFVTAEESHLPPDNFQTDPIAEIAHRSSPTNFGLYLLSILAAKDFGWIGLTEMTERLSQTLKSLSALPKYQGHFYNWYETTEARPLEPRYISSVDNGNLAGHLLAVTQGCLEKLSEPVIASGFNRGILATLLLLDETSRSAKNFLTEENFRTFSLKLQELSMVLMIPDHRISNRSDHWNSLKSMADELLTEAKKIKDFLPEDHSQELIGWSRALKQDIESTARDFFSLVSWTDFSIDFSDKAFEENLKDHELQLWRQIQENLEASIPLKDFPARCGHLISKVLLVKRNLKSYGSLHMTHFLDSLIENLELSSSMAQNLIHELLQIRQQCYSLFHEMDFKKLYDPIRKLFSIGLRVADQTLDPSYYDLLASEARLTSFIAIAKGDIPVSHWFSLGRSLTPTSHGAVLVSWSGSMFEYLMPSLVMQTPAGSLLEQTCQGVIRRQMDYASLKGVPWGISESAYNKRDLHLTYQYSNFGIPDLALKRGLAADLVIAPYASFLAAMYDSATAAANLKNLEKSGAYGAYGFYEAVDYTSARLKPGQSHSVVKTYMAHHQGMSLVALVNVFKNGIMQKRFHSEPLVQATELLLQERTPRNVGTLKPNDEPLQITSVRETAESTSRIYHSPDRPIPTTLLLSDGVFSTMLTSAGSGYSRFKDIALTRWREDVTRDHWGHYFFYRDPQTNKVWSATYQPTCAPADTYEVNFTEDRAIFTREDDDIRSRLEVFISSEESSEIRQLTLTNSSTNARALEVTSYCEVVINTPAADIAHPAFSNLFVQTEYIPEINALVAHRRPRSSHESPLWMGLVLWQEGTSRTSIEFETDRARFLGRDRSSPLPLAMRDSHSLSCTVGAVLDPIFSFRTQVWLEPEINTQMTFITLTASSREDLILKAEKYRQPSTYERVSNLAWTQAQIKLHYLNIDLMEAHQFQRLATRLLYMDSSLRPSIETLRRNVKDVTGLWSLGISGDVPIILLRIDDIEDRNMVRQLLKAQEYLGTKRLAVDLVILNEKSSSYAQELQQTLESMVHMSLGRGHMDLPQSRGKVFILRTDLLSPVDIDLLYAEARVTLSSRLGNLAEQVKRMRLLTPRMKKRAKPNLIPLRDTQLELPPLEGFNGFGGFSQNEYVIALRPGISTPAPWINVISHSQFGFQVSESGSGYTWNANSRENQLTPWSNDPIGDPSGEAFYLLDKTTDELWSPMATPIRRPEGVYIARHGQGYSRFEHLSYEIYTELTQFVVENHPAKISKLVIENRSHRPRSLSVIGYVEWVLGFSRSIMAPTTLTEFDDQTNSLFAYNPRHSEFGTHVAFFTLLRQPFSFTGDRTEFIGRNGSLSEPQGLFQEGGLSGKTGAALDPCSVIKTEIELAPHSQIEVCFILGQEKSREHARSLIRKIRARKAHEILNESQMQWSRILETVQVTTPDIHLNWVMNSWWLYQTLACRIYSRSAFYQAGGAYGFRDQLQDVMALVYTRPDLVREQILRAASRQFIEGDVQHWWHPPTGRGVRTHFSDDLLWLPYVVSHYLNVTQDQSLLDAEAPFIEGASLRPDQEDAYYTPVQSHQSASVYEHCARALDRSLKVGSHGLPLMGCGDWNDGMNRVGWEGKGESVWLGWFLIVNLRNFEKIALQKGEMDRAEKWSQHLKLLTHNIEKEAWDGEWYRRAFYDDGSPLGSSQNEECQIDSLAQTWAVLSEVAPRARAETAMQSLEKKLLKEKEQLVLLFTPPFDKTPRDPGYIKGYLPGVRENGGQYTHAAAWCVMAFAQLGQTQKAIDLLKTLNPLNHTQTQAAVELYKIEPYVLAGDVYSQTPHQGRGGWSWYTGSAGWMYRAALEFVLGFRVRGPKLEITPKAALIWSNYEITYRYHSAQYKIQVQSIVGSQTQAWIDGQEVKETGSFDLKDDGNQHLIRIEVSKNQNLTHQDSPHTLAHF